MRLRASQSRSLLYGEATPRAKVVGHARRVVFQMPEVAVTLRMFEAMLKRITWLESAHR